MADLLSIGASGLAASQTALSVTGNNVTNADTEGYSRQTVSQSSALSTKQGNFYLGNGTTLADVRRVYSSYLGTQLQVATALSSDAQSYSTQASSVDSLLSDGTTGISTVLQNLFSALQTASSLPDDTGTRQQLLAQADSLSDRFNSVYSQLDGQNSSINQQLSSLTTNVNKLTSSIAQYNQQIATLSANASGAEPNDLLDARDEAVRQLNETIGATVVNQNGTYNVYLNGSGQPLVMGNSASTLSVSPSKSDPTQYGVTLTRNQSSLDVTSTVTGGEMGGLLRYRSDMLDSTTNELGRMALVVADTLNSQLQQGVDLNGDMGSALFTDINSTDAVSQRSVAQSGNASSSGNFAVTIDDTSQLTTSNYQVQFTDSTHYTVTRLSDGTVFPDSNGSTYDSSATEDPVIDGFSLSLDGTAAAGDKFTIMPTRYAAGDISVAMTDASQLALAAPLSASASSDNTGTGSITEEPSVGFTQAGTTDLSSLFSLGSTTSLVLNGQSIDLGSAASLSDVVSTINNAGTGVTASSSNGQLVLSSAEDFSVADGNTGTATTLGLTASSHQSISGDNLDSGTPLKMVFGAVATDGTQSYTLSDALGNPVGTGMITPGQSNALTITTTPADPEKAFTFSMTLNGSPASGDSFTITTTGADSTDNRNAQSLLALQTADTVAVSSSGSGMSFSGAYSSLVENVGSKTSQAQLDVSATSTALSQAQDSVSSYSGVNLDEEATRLIKYQQYYNAAAQIIQVARDTFDTLLSKL